MRTGNHSLAIAFRIAVIGALAAGCSGGDGTDALTRTTTEPPGAHCADGGQKLEVGIDGNHSGVLDDSEVNDTATSYVCNGGGTISLIATSPEPAGASCPFGGTRIDTGIDANGNGTLDAT